ncbi:alpha-hydroxy-acid oxidizing protein [Paraburkholderia sediminicola]|uniref:alpha-hydroxy-acid oxidizing protein n=1 Tax=Paraburkholderia sediminicola TaxID=458836 RepID=UPI0038B9D6FB
MFSVKDYRAAAKRRLPRMVFDYLEGGADDESGLGNNRAAFERWELTPSRLVDVSHRDQTISLFGRTLPTPLVIAPTGLNAAFWPSGDAALARAAGEAGIPFALSTASNMSIEEVARQATGDLWFQLYVVNRTLACSLVRRARAANYSTLVLTTDVAVNGFRERDIRNGFAMPFKFSARAAVDGLTHPRWLWSYLSNGMPQLENFVTGDTLDIASQAALLRREMDASFNWDDLCRIRDEWRGKLIVKGVLTAEDVARCVQAGADGVILSNHGGRQLADLPVPLDVLPGIRERSPSTAILLDSGVRRGGDVVKSIALGANAVMLGRATLYGLAARGEVGVSEVIGIVKQEIDRTLALIGCSTVRKLNSSYVTRSPA